MEFSNIEISSNLSFRMSDVLYFLTFFQNHNININHLRFVQEGTDYEEGRKNEKAD